MSTDAAISQGLSASFGTKKKKEWESQDVEYVKEAEGIVECKLRKLGTVAAFEYDPNDYSRPMSENYGIYSSFILLLIGIIIALSAI